MESRDIGSCTGEDGGEDESAHVVGGEEGVEGGSEYVKSLENMERKKGTSTTQPDLDLNTSRLSRVRISKFTFRIRRFAWVHIPGLRRGTRVNLTKVRQN